MTITFEELCNDLGLTPMYTDESQLDVLESWCYHAISQDLRYTGSNEEKYTQYYSLVSTYLNDFLPYTPTHLAQKIPQFENLNSIQYAAEHGYNRYIQDQPTLHDSILNAEDEEGMTPLHSSAAASTLAI